MSGEHDTETAYEKERLEMKSSTDGQNDLKNVNVWNSMVNSLHIAWNIVKNENKLIDKPEM